MANIQQYLAELEYRLAPSLDHQLLQERLTEAENHLRDRAQEFEEIGLPRIEAEARAVADFGDADEFAQNLPPRFVPPAPPKVVEEVAPAKPIEVPERRDIALQLAWSAAALGLVAGVFASAGLLAGGCAAAMFVGLGGLFGRPTKLRQMAALSIASSVVLFFVLSTAYEPVQLGWEGVEKIGIKHRNEESSVERAHNYAVEELKKFEKMAADVKLGNYPRSPYGGGYVIPTVNSGYGTWRYRYLYSFGPMETDSLEHAKEAWQQDEEAARRSILQAINGTTMPPKVWSPFEINSLFSRLAFLGGVVMMAAMAGLQAIFMAIRGLFAWFGRLVRRASQPRTASRGWEPYR